MPHASRPYCARNWGHPLHSLCSYPSKMKPGLAYHLVRLFSRPGDVVLDPFAGVGTIPFEACLGGRRGVASDINPLAVAVSKAKLTKWNATAVEEALRIIEQHGGTPPSAPEEITDFFHPDTLAEIGLARGLLLGGSVPGSPLILAALAHVMHGNRPYALSRRSHGIIPIPPKGPAMYKPVVPAIRDKLRRTRHWDLPPTFLPGEALSADAACLPLGDGTIDVVITSPPFLGTTDFMRQNRLRLWLAGWEYDRQHELKAEMARFSKTWQPYLDVLREIGRVLKPNGTAVLHLGKVKGVDMAQVLSEHLPNTLKARGIVYEDTTRLESHGRTDRGATAEHSYLVVSRG